MSRPPTDPSLPQDPHLQAALRHAPDADAQAPAALSARILEAAREQAAHHAPPQPAAAPRARPAPAPWWKWLLGSSAPRGMGPRWASGMALLFVTVVAGLIWIPQRPGVDIQPPRPQAQAERRLQERDAGPTAATGGQQEPRAEKPAAAVALRQDAPPGPAPAGTLAKARQHAGQPAGKDKQDSDALMDAAPQPLPSVAAPPPAVTAPAQARDAAAPPPALPPTPAMPARKQALEAANEDSLASTREAEKKSADVGVAGRARATALSAPSAEAGALPWQALRRQLAQAAEQRSAFLSGPKEEASAAAPATWRLMPEGRPQPADAQAMSWLDELAAATGEWKRIDTPPAQLRTSAWALEWQAQGLGRMQLLMAEGHAWWRAQDGRWWQAALPDEAAGTLQRDARGMLAPTDAAKPGNPR